MKQIRNMILLAVLSAVICTTCTGCQFVDSWNMIMGTDSETMTAEEIQTMKDSKVIKIVDDSMDAPVFEANLGESYDYTVGSVADTLQVEASVTTGSVTYQWYYNTADTNGGGEPIEGATETTYTPSTAEEGTTYYYCVATNSIGDKFRESTSQCATVVVSEEATEDTVSAETVSDTEETSSDSSSEKSSSKKSSSKKSSSKKSSSKKSSSK